MPPPSVLKLIQPEADPLPEAKTIEFPKEIAPGISFKDGALQIEHADGSATIDFNPDMSEPDDKSDKFYANLAKKIDPGKLGEIATDLLDGIQRDEDSSKEWMETRRRGIELLGLKLEEPRGDVGTSSAPLEGMSTVRHPLLLEATIRFQATARGELLPAAGPVKVRNDSPNPPYNLPPVSPPPQMSSVQGAPPPPQPPRPVSGDINDKDNLSEALEKDFNHYLTAVATEYVPDTDRMLFTVGFGGEGIKKVFNCPIRRRPVSESVQSEDFIISNAAVELRNCPRVTHKIKMSKSVLRRMQIIGAYRDVELSPPTIPQTTPVDQITAEIVGQRLNQQRPKDQEYTVYETYCELDLDDYAPAQFKGKGLPLPYRVTIEKNSRQVLSVIRNWDKDDKQCLAKQFFVQFPFIRGIGFRGLGFIHLLGNTTSTLTAAWREMLDSGMFANFPGFIYAKQVGRQLTNQFRVPPGGGIGLEIGSMTRVQDAFAPLPYKDVGAGHAAFIKEVADTGARLGQTAEIQVGEGKQDAPVGTTLALIEQATKMLDAVHKRMHAAQAEEFGLLKQRFKENPEAFWRSNKNPTVAWKKAQFLKALDDNNLVPVADPNNPTSLHRAAKAATLKQLQQANPALYDPVAVDMRVLRMTEIDPEGLFRPVPAAPPPDPRMLAIQAKSQSQDKQNQIQLLETQIKAATQAAAIHDKAAERQSREKIEQMKLRLAELKLDQENVIHQNEVSNDDARAQQQLQTDAIQKVHEIASSHAQTEADLANQNAQNQQDMAAEQARRAQEMQITHAEHLHAMGRAHDEHQRAVSRQEEKHRQELEHRDRMHEAKLAQARSLAKVAKKRKTTKSGE